MENTQVQFPPVMAKNAAASDITSNCSSLNLFFKPDWTIFNTQYRIIFNFFVSFGLLLLSVMSTTFAEYSLHSVPPGLLQTPSGCVCRSQTNSLLSFEIPVQFKGLFASLLWCLSVSAKAILTTSRRENCAPCATISPLIATMGQPS